MKSLLQALTCLSCGKSYAGNSRFLRCPACGGLLDPQYRYEALFRKVSWQSFQETSRSIWRWRALLPVENMDCEVTLGEGDTPLIRAARLGAKLGLDRLFIKNDGLNPTGSLKDRSIAVAVSKAVQFGYPCVSTDSSGNKAASLAAYAAKAGLKAVVFCPASTPRQKLLQTLMHGAQLILIDGRRMDVACLYEEAARRRQGDWYDVGTANPFRYEGKKTYAYELAEAFKGKGPDWILQPAGGSMSVTKTWKGFQELRHIGLVSRTPRLVGVQAMNCAPIAKAFRLNRAEVLPVDPSLTIAGGVAIADPGPLGTLTLHALRESGGLALAVSEGDIERAMNELAEEGIFAEPTGAITIAALRRLCKDGKIKRDENVVCIVTGVGFKDLDTVTLQVQLPKAVRPSMQAIEKALSR